MSKIFQFYRLINVLSLDVVAGAIVGALFFSRIFSVVVMPYELIALGFTVWIIYTADHLRDAKNLKHRASTDRHQFHQLHYKALTKVMAGVIIADAFVVLFIQTEVLYWGIVVAAAVAVYLLIHQSLKFFKEIFIATLYTCGILSPSLSVTQVDVNLTHYLIIFHFAILALINLLLFSWFDLEPDQQDRQHSLVTIVGERITTTIIWLLIVFQSVLMLVQIYQGQNNQAAILLGSMGLLFVMIMIFNRSLEQNDYYRFVGDAVFIVPILYLL